MRKGTKGTSDFGFSRTLNSSKLYKADPRYAAYIWAIQAFSISTSIVGLGALTVGFGITKYYDFKSVRILLTKFEDFRMRFRSYIQEKYPGLRGELDEEIDAKELSELLSQIDNASEYKPSKLAELIGSQFEIFGSNKKQ